MVFTGNRPSSSLLLTRLDAFAVGQLLALYEHRTAVQGFLWGLNSFDHFGLELGRALARKVRSQICAARRTGASVQGFNYSTSALLERYLSHKAAARREEDDSDDQAGAAAAAAAAAAAPEPPP
jgi:glucose-6-phosphate isomerase